MTKFKELTASNYGSRGDLLYFRADDGNTYCVDKSSISESLNHQLPWQSNGLLSGEIKLLILNHDDGSTDTYIFDPSRQKKKERQEKTVSFGTEGLQLEFKSSLYHCADRLIDETMDDKPRQFRELARQLCGFAHAHCTGRLIVGVSDDGTPLGLNSEVRDIRRTEDELRNYFSQVLNIRFTSTLTFEWKTINERLILIISIPEWTGDIVTVFGTEVYLRVGASCHKLRSQDLVDFIRTYNN